MRWQPQLNVLFGCNFHHDYTNWSQKKKHKKSLQTNIESHEIDSMYLTLMVMEHKQFFLTICS